MKISESGYYRWLKNRSKPTKQQLLLVEIKKILSEHPDNTNYGYNRMYDALMQKDVTASKSKVYRAMKAGGYIHKQRRPRGLTKATKEIQEKENLIKQNFFADEPMKKLLTDITQIQCADGKLYISPIMDCFNGEIVTLEMGETMKKDLCIDIIKQLGRMNNVNSGVYFKYCVNPLNGVE